jgi:hypothetical protein
MLARPVVALSAYLTIPDRIDAAGAAQLAA